MTKKEYIRQMDDEQFTEMLVNYETTLLIPSCNEKYCEHCKGDGYVCAAKDDGVTAEQGCAKAIRKWLDSEVSDSGKWYE